MKCQSKQLGLLQDPERPSWSCENEGDHKMELKFDNPLGKTIKGNFCSNCVKSVLKIVGKKQDIQLVKKNGEVVAYSE